MSTNTFDVITECLAECEDADPDYAPDEEHDRADCILEALGRAGMEIVELPKPDDNGDFINVRLVTPKNWPTEINLGRMYFTPDRARDIGAQLIAAAQAVEAQS